MDRSPCSKQPRCGHRRCYPTWRLVQSRAAPCRHSEKSLYQQLLSAWKRVPGEGEHPVEHHGVRVCALCPGPTASEFQKVAGVPDDLSMGLEPADRVAREGLRALAAGEHSVISGFTNW